MNCRVLLLIVACLGSFTGCSGESAGRKPTFSVTGKVTFNGGAVAGALVTFVPKEGQPAATAKTDDSGMFSLSTYGSKDGAAEGKYVAVVTKTLMEDGGEAPEEEHGTDLDETGGPSAHDAESEESENSSLLPGKYASAETSDLEVTVVAGEDNVIDLPLQ